MLKKKNKKVNEFEKEYIVITTEKVNKVSGYLLGSFCNIEVYDEQYCYLMSKEDIKRFIKDKGSNCIKHISKNIKCDLEVIIDVKD